MSTLIHSHYLRWVYAFGLMVLGLIISLLVMAADDEGGSHSNAGVWILLAAMATLFGAGFWLAPRLHAWLRRLAGKKVQSSGSGKNRSSRKSSSRS